MKLEQSVARHYAHDSLERVICGALEAAGKDLGQLLPADLAPVDEFHIGGRQATVDFADGLAAGPGLHLLDIGAGLGGASRYFAHERGCRVTGIDLTEDYVHAAAALAKLVGLESRVSYRQGSALSLPFASGSFDGAYMLHVGMNIQDKLELFAEARRVAKTGGVFGIYDVMRAPGEGELSFPLPWASGPEASFVERPLTYRQLLEAAGFGVEKVRSRSAFAIEFFDEMRARAVQGGGPPPLGIHLLMGPSAAQKIANLTGALERGLIAPVEIFCRAI